MCNPLALCWPKLLPEAAFTFLPTRIMSPESGADTIFIRVRVSASNVSAIADKLNVLIALDKPTINIHRQELTSDGITIFDGEQITDVKQEKGFFSVPFNRLAESEAGNKLMANTVALGAAAGLVGYDLPILNDVLQFQFGAGDLTERNIKAARAGYDFVRKNYNVNSSQVLEPS